jgi:cell division septation protein DedD
VQLGSFSKRDNAERLAGDLKRKGFSSAVLGGGGSSGSLFRVRAGPVGDKAAAEALAARLAAAGFGGGRVGRK